MPTLDETETHSRPTKATSTNAGAGQSAFSRRRSRDRANLVRSVAASSTLTLMGVLATAVMVVVGPVLGLVVIAIATLGACCSLIMSVQQLSRQQALWVRWPTEGDVVVSDSYDSELAAVKAASLKWEIPMLVSWGTACAVGGAWALASGQWAIGLATWITMLGCALGASNGELGSEVDDYEASEAFEDDSAASPAVDSEPIVHVTFETAEAEPAAVTKAHWRCLLTSTADSPADLLVLTSSGIDMLKTAPDAWENLGNRNLSAAMTFKYVSDAIEGSGSWRDLADIELRRFDAFVDEHGYNAVSAAAESRVSFAQDVIAFAGIYQRRYVSSYYFEIEMFDGTTDRRDLIADDKRLESLRNLLSDLGYSQRFQETVQMAERHA